MAENGKSRILYLADLLCRETDETHPMTEPAIETALCKGGFIVERKTVYDDLRTLSECGYDIGCRRGASGGYYLAERRFEMTELKLLVDAVQAAKFVSEKRSRELISKICRFASRYQERSLNRQVYVLGRVKSDNPSIYYTVDAVFEAIDSDRSISFRYLDWTLARTLAPRREQRYHVSPYAMMWDDENYYLIAYDNDSSSVRHYRVDKMRDTLKESSPREGQAFMDGIDLAQYSKQMFGMYRGEAETVTLLCDASLVGVIIDRFGDEVTLRPSDDKASFLVTVRVMTSPVFLGWVAGFGSKMRITEPHSLARRMQDLAFEIAQTYKNTTEKE